MLGSCDTLMNWDIEHALSMTTTKHSFPWWSAQAMLVVGDDIEYKFAVISVKGDITWEPCYNRQCKLTRQDLLDSVSQQADGIVFYEVFGDQLLRKTRFRQQQQQHHHRHHHPQLQQKQVEVERKRAVEKEQEMDMTRELERETEISREGVKERKRKIDMPSTAEKVKVNVC
mmetsp:Transcript_43843/g.64361  ORF Transcript_43843/g.64361 Transcript_43843/m.64361 type:complete len:172 (+) Transcript_43843:64-579(+)